MLLTPRCSRSFVRILSDGTIRRKVSPDVSGAQLRKWKLPDGTTGETWELVFESIEGRITKVWFTDSNFGPQINTTITDNGDEVTLSIGLNSRFADSFMQRLPGVDFAQPVRLVPYVFSDDKGKKRCGVTFYQGGEKIGDYFRGEGQEGPLHGFPSPAGDEKTADDWKIFFLSVRKFLRRYITSEVVPSLESANKPPASESEYAEPIIEDDIAF